MSIITKPHPSKNLDLYKDVLLHLFDEMKSDKGVCQEEYLFETEINLQWALKVD